MVQIATLDSGGKLTPAQVPALATLGATATGEALIEAADAAAARTAIGATAAGSAVLTAADAAAQRTAIGMTAAGSAVATAADADAQLTALGAQPAADLDTDVTALDANAASALRVQQDARLLSTYATTAQGTMVTQGVLQRLAAGVTDVTVVVIGDSTGNETGEWFDLAMRDLQARFPAYSLDYAAWDDGTQQYGALAEAVAGTGAYTIKAYNASVAGKTFYYSYGDNIATQVGDLQPDLVFINYGHNEGTAGTETAYELHRDLVASLTEPIRAQCPTAAIVLMSQNPRYDVGVTADISAHRAFRVRQVAQMQGYGFVDVNAAFLAHADPASLVDVDGIHPTAAGSRVWADEIGRLLTPQVTAQPHPIAPSSLLIAGANLLTNGTFADFASPPTLPSWTAVNATLSKDATNYESPHAWSLRVQATASGSQCRIYQDISKGLVLGQWLTVAARLRVPTGQASTVGRVQIADSTGTSTSRSNAGPRDQWYWATVSRRVAAAATYVQIRLYGDTGTAGGADLSCDRIILARGQLPRDCY